MTDISEENIKIGKKLPCIAIVEGVTYSSSLFEIAAALQAKDDEISALKSRIEELEKDMEWKPIETAPKDGTWIITTCGNNFLPCIVRWCDFLDWPELFHSDFIKPRWLGDEQGREQTNEQLFDEISGSTYEPTHWMPLPQQPKEPNE